jgi:hypothetical protein
MNANSFKFWVKWPLNIEISERRDGVEFIRYDKARRILTETGEQYHHLKRLNKKIKPIPYNMIKHSPRGMVAKLYSPSPAEFIPYKDVEGQNIIVEDPYLNQWGASENKKAVIKWAKKTNWDKYLPIMMLIMFGIVMAVMLIMIIGKMTELAQSLQGIGNGLSDVSNTLVGAIEKLTNETTRITANRTVNNLPLPSG